MAVGSSQKSAQAGHWNRLWPVISPCGCPKMRSCPLTRHDALHLGSLWVAETRSWRAEQVRRSRSWVPCVACRRRRRRPAYRRRRRRLLEHGPGPQRPAWRSRDSGSALRKTLRGLPCPSDPLTALESDPSSVWGPGNSVVWVDQAKRPFIGDDCAAARGKRICNSSGAPTSTNTPYAQLRQGPTPHAPTTPPDPCRHGPPPSTAADNGQHNETLDVACHRLLHRLGFEPGPREMSDGQGVEEES